LLHRGQVVRGSQLQDPAILLRLLTWFPPQKPPELVVVLVDADGDTGRRTRMRKVAEGKVGSHVVVIAVAVEEFEAWLLADVKPWNAIGPAEHEELGNVEGRRPGRTKELVVRRARESGLPEAEVRHRVVSGLDLDVLSGASASFRQFVDDLRQASHNIP
jgi:hypothetical protein